MASPDDSIYLAIDNTQMPATTYRRTPDHLLQSGGGGGTSDGMESRINRLEERLDKVVNELGETRINLATIIERISHLPTKSYIDTRLVGLLGTIASIVLFADRIKSWIGLPH